MVRDVVHRASLALALVLPAAAGQAEPVAREHPAAPDTACVATFSTAGLVFVEVERRSERPLLALLDTGASASALDPARARDLALVGTGEVVGTTGRLAVELVELDGLALGGVALPTLRATRRDLAGLLAPSGRTVEMILGSDALRELVVTIDFERARLELGAPTDARSGTPMALDNGIPTLPATLGGVETLLRIDTGASLFATDEVYVNVPTALWHAIAARHPGLTPTAHLSGTGAGGAAVDLAVYTVPHATLGPLVRERVQVIVQPEAGYFADPAARGFVGNNLLAKLGRVTLDYPGRRLRAEPPGPPPAGR
jgi:hypothetical protein